MNLNKLNRAQYEAATTIHGPVLVLSGAGTGKTRTITYRIANMLKNGIEPDSILAVTFTNKASKEMQERVYDIIGSDSKNLHVSTFHKLGLKILYEFPEQCGVRNNFTIYAQNDQLSVIRKVIRQFPQGFQSYKPEDILFALNSKRVPTKKGIELLNNNTEISYVLHEAWNKYQEALKNANAVDFEDLLILPLYMLKHNAEILEYYRNKFKYILVDEYQDTNKIQFNLINLLAEKHRNLYVVGDDDQSIYGWRGAEIKNILDFEKFFPEAKVIRLEENYRSTQTILNAANAVIEKNDHRKPKKLWCSNCIDDKIKLITASDDMSEADLIIRDLKNHCFSNSYKFNDYVLLMRTNTQSRQYEEALRIGKVPYTIIGGMKFFDRKEIQDFFSFLKLLVNPDDDEAFSRIINVPPRGIGETALATIHNISVEKKCALYKALPEAIQKIKQADGLLLFYNMMENLKAKIIQLKPSELAKELLESIDYEKELKKVVKKNEDLEIKMQNIESVIDDIAYYERNNREASISDYLRKIMLETEDKDEKLEKDHVTLMTIHSSKGLEFPFVYIVGTEQGIMPHQHSLEENRLEEERRLFYVAITRAQKRLVISYAKNRMKYGKLVKRNISQFVEDIPKDLLDLSDGTQPQATKEQSKKFLEEIKRKLKEN